MRATWKVAGLLFCSGACALIYQTVWMRQFRLIFGASTAATAAVLAIFMAGLGAGSAILGRRADASALPLRLYGTLELMIAVAAALSQPLLWIAAKLYIAIGGSVTLGIFFATIARLILTTIVLGGATFLMGGTLPAAARAVESEDDASRRRVALLYGLNTLGAVLGTLLATFYALERLGNRETLLTAVGVNALVGIAARFMRTSGAPVHSPAGIVEGGNRLPKAALFASATTGFTFLLMELVWYRLLSPLLGGSTFTFGLILAVALLGIGIGGAAYAFWSANRQATAAAFGITCALEAIALAIPFALGDRIAVFALYLRPLGAIGFGGFVMAWTLVTMAVVLPAAIISGVQFPLMISLLGRGEAGVGNDVGAMYAWNTAGAIAGSLAGGFGLLPLIGAPGAWRVGIIMLALLAIAAALTASWAPQALVAATSVLAISATFALGPTAVWRHSGIGAGRSETPDTANNQIEWMYRTRRTTVWDRDGRESSVALVDTSDYAFMVNGKADGSARGDAGTQVMAGLVPAILHRDPRRALVIGLGTGSTAGWLGAIPQMETVDVVELEPAILDVARACAAVNHDVLRNAKVRIRIGDAREVLLASRKQYDIVFSEPSNPYRAGIASLFTEEFYRASAARLREGGIFGQWVQSYEVDSQTIRTIYATLSSVFPNVETWTTDSGDVLLLATRSPIVYDFDRLRQRVAAEPFRTAMLRTWRKDSLEGFLAHFLARGSMTRAIARAEKAHNTDDRPVIEFGFARGVGSTSRFSMDDLAALARTRGEDLPAGRGNVDWRAVASNRASLSWVNGVPPAAPPEDQARHRAAGDEDNLAQALAEWRARPFTPIHPGERALLGEALADDGSDAAEAYANELRKTDPIDADAILARLRFRQSRIDDSVTLLERVFVGCRRDPWPTVSLIGRSLDLANEIATIHPYGAILVRSLEQPFAAGQWNDARRIYRVTMAHEQEGCGPTTLRALRELEPWTVWRADILKIRRDCYATSQSDLAPRAKEDYARYSNAEPMPFNRGVLPAPSGSSSSHR